MLMTRSAINYCWRQLALRAGLVVPIGAETGFEALDISLSYNLPGQIPPSTRGLVVRCCAGDAWSKLLTAPENSLQWMLARKTVPEGCDFAVTDPIPVLFWGVGLEEGNRPFVERSTNGSIIFNADILAATLFMLSRWEEIGHPTRDAHERFPAIASIAYKQGYLDRPIVDQYALILREWLRVLVPDWKPNVRGFSVRLSHDIDEIRRLRNAKLTIRAVGADLIKRRNPQLALDTLRSSLNSEKDPFYTGIYSLADISIKHGFTNDAFYFMVSDPSEIDNDYNVDDPHLRKTLDYLQKIGFEIGIHPSYNTLDNLILLEKEKARLDRVLQYSKYGGRQHFLRFKTPFTWRHWEAAGLEYDSTLGYADYEGFRCGTCHPYHPFDIEHNREIGIEELPLVVMDGTLADYRKLQPAKGYQSIMKLAHRCKEVGGTFTLLWHNSSLCGRFYPWARTYERVLQALSTL